MARFDIITKTNKTILSIEGRLTLADKSVFDAFVQENLKDGNGYFGINLNELEYIDSAGIGDLIKLKMQAAKIYKAVYVFGVEGVVERVFRVSGLTSVFEVITTDDFDNL